MRFPHENITISLGFFHGVPLFGLGLILGVFWGLPGDPPGARCDQSGFQLGHLAASGVLGGLLEPCGTNLGFSWVTLCLLGSLVTQIWAPVR